MKCSSRTCSNEADDGFKSCTRCREYRKTYYENYRAKRPRAGLCCKKDCPNTPKPGFKTCERCLARQKAYEDSIRPQLREGKHKWYQQLKGEVFEKYGGPVCACCGVTHIEFLSIDHSEGNGAAHRAEVNGDPRNGKNLYVWLRKNNFPPGFRVLCMNCNFSLGHHGYCPHHPEVKQSFISGRPRKEPAVQPTT